MFQLSSFIMAIMLLLPTSALSVDVDGLEYEWRQGEARRMFVETRVDLPRAMWFFAERNREARISSFHIRISMNCNDVGVLRRGWQVTCQVEDAALSAVAMPGDEAQLAQILPELDAALDGALVSFTVRHDGQMSRVALESERGTSWFRRGNAMGENLRLMVSRAVAGLDLQLPRRGRAADGMWVQRNSRLFETPSAYGTLGSAQIVHAAHDQGEMLLIESSGRGILSPGARDGEPQDVFDTRLHATSFFDPERGMLVQHTWQAIGLPTASTTAEIGGADLPYAQKGSLRWLAEGQNPVVGLSEVMEATGPQPTVLHGGSSFGVSVRPLPSLIAPVSALSQDW